MSRSPTELKRLRSILPTRPPRLPLPHAPRTGRRREEADPSRKAVSEQRRRLRCILVQRSAAALAAEDALNLERHERVGRTRRDNPRAEASAPEHATERLVKEAVGSVDVGASVTAAARRFYGNGEAGGAVQPPPTPAHIYPRTWARDADDEVQRAAPRAVQRALPAQPPDLRLEEQHRAVEAHVAAAARSLLGVVCDGAWLLLPAVGAQRRRCLGRDARKECGEAKLEEGRRRVGVHGGKRGGAHASQPASPPPRRLSRHRAAGTP